MNNRRTFLKYLSGSLILGNLPRIEASAAKQEINIGIIGAENSHTAAYGKMFNIDKLFPGIKVLYVWGETDEFAKIAAEKGGIPNIVKHPSEMLGKINALIIDHRHAKYHLEAALPFLKERIPIFIDKPFCYRLSDGKAFIEQVRKYNSPISSYSSIGHSTATFNNLEKIKNLGTIHQVLSAGPVDVQSPYGGVFFYGVHLVQPLLFMFGNEVQKVKVNTNGNASNATMVWKNGLMATLIFKKKFTGWETFIETDKGLTQLVSDSIDEKPELAYRDMVKFFRTGKENRTHESMLAEVAVLEALEESVSSNEWVNIKDFRL
jgi:predicted dehydrogenase